MHRIARILVTVEIVCCIGREGGNSRHNFISVLSLNFPLTFTAARSLARPTDRPRPPSLEWDVAPSCYVGFPGGGGGGGVNRRRGAEYVGILASGRPFHFLPHLRTLSSLVPKRRTR